MFASGEWECPLFLVLTAVSPEPENVPGPYQMLNNYLLNDTDWQKRKLDGLFVSVGVEENRHFRVLLVSVNWNYLFGE